MNESVAWETDLDAALRRAKGLGKVVLLDFFNPG